MPRGLGKSQRWIKDVLQRASEIVIGGPLDFAFIRDIAISHRGGDSYRDRLNPTYERSLKRSLKALVDSGDVVIVAGKGGQLDPYCYTTVEAFAASTGETVKDTAHAKLIVAELHQAEAEQGYAKAQFTIGATYALGYGVPRDPVVAYSWLIRSAAKDDRNAIRNFLARRMTSAQIAEAKKLAREWRAKYEKK